LKLDVEQYQNYTQGQILSICQTWIYILLEVFGLAQAIFTSDMQKMVKYHGF
jgi:hypothetical protein